MTAGGGDSQLWAWRRWHAGLTRQAADGIRGDLDGPVSGTDSALLTALLDALAVHVGAASPEEVLSRYECGNNGGVMTMTREAILAECRAAHHNREISDWCAHSIMKLHATGQALALEAYLATQGEWPEDETDDDGNVTCDGKTRLWRALFFQPDGTYKVTLSEDDKLMAAMLATWLRQDATAEQVKRLFGTA